MTRLFHARTPLTHWLLLAVLLLLVVYAGWHRYALIMAAGLLLLVVVVERIIHTSYTLTADMLIVHTSRFARDIHVPIAAIERVERIEGQHILGRALHSCLVVSYTAPDGRSLHVSLRPQNESDFVIGIQRRREKMFHSRHY